MSRSCNLWTRFLRGLPPMRSFSFHRILYCRCYYNSTLGLDREGLARSTRPVHLVLSCPHFAAAGTRIASRLTITRSRSRRPSRWPSETPPTNASVKPGVVRPPTAPPEWERKKDVNLPVVPRRRRKERPPHREAPHREGTAVIHPRPGEIRVHPLLRMVEAGAGGCPRAWRGEGRALEKPGPC